MPVALLLCLLIASSRAMTGEVTVIAPADVFLAMDLSRPGLEDVRQATERRDSVRAAAAFLAYFRLRTSVNYMVNPASRSASRGKAASEDDLEVARQALDHVFITDHPRIVYRAGKDIKWRPDPDSRSDWILLNRMSWWHAMARAYWHTGNEEFAKEWAAQFIDWTRKYQGPSGEPRLNFGIRAYNLSTVMPMFRDSRAVTPELLLEYLRVVYLHAAYLAAKYSAGHNFGLMESEGLAFIAMTFPEFKESATWRDTALKRLAAELANQVYPDGIQRELSFAYHCGAILWFTRSMVLAELNGIQIPNSYKAKLATMYDVAYALKPDGTIPMFGDSENIRVVDQLGEAAARMQRPDVEYITSAISGKPRGKPPVATSFMFPNAGYYVFRSGWDSNAVWMAVKCGPNGDWHCQPDNGTFELFAHGSYLMPDSGSYVYFGDDQAREWFRSTARHQCLTLDGANSAYAPRRLLWSTADDLTVLTIENQSYRDLAHRRTIFFALKKLFIIVDETIGDARGRRRLHFQFGAPDMAVERDGGIRLDGPGNGRLIFKPLITGFVAEREIGQVSFEMNKKQSRAAISYDLDGRSVFASMLLPYIGNTAPVCSVSLMDEAYAAGDDALRLHLRLDGRSYILSRELRRATASLQESEAPFQVGERLHR